MTVFGGTSSTTVDVPYGVFLVYEELDAVVTKILFFGTGSCGSGKKRSLYTLDGSLRNNSIYFVIVLHNKIFFR